LLDRNKEAKNLYLELIGQAVAQVKARGLGNWEDDCWEGVEWTFSLLTDCYYRIGVCYQDMNDQDSAITFFKMFIGLRTRWTGGIYTVGDALVRLEAISPVDREDFGRIVEAEVAATLR